jgi:hypothetical protein
MSHLIFIMPSNLANSVLMFIKCSHKLLKVFRGSLNAYLCPLTPRTPGLQCYHVSLTKLLPPCLYELLGLILGEQRDTNIYCLLAEIPGVARDSR